MAVRRRRPEKPAARSVTRKPVSDAVPAKLRESSGNPSTRQKRYINRQPLKQVYYRSTEDERNRSVQQIPADAAGDAQVVSARYQKSANKSSAASKIGYRVESSAKTATGPSSVDQLRHRKQYSSRYDDFSDSKTESGGGYICRNNKRTERKRPDSPKECYSRNGEGDGEKLHCRTSISTDTSTDRLAKRRKIGHLKPEKFDGTRVLQRF